MSGRAKIPRQQIIASKGKTSTHTNIYAAKMLADVLKTSLGPVAMDKMLVDAVGDVNITNDGATMLKEIDVQHPVVKLMVEISKGTDSEVGDGTTSSVILAGTLLAMSEELVNKDVHATIIVDGYKTACEKAQGVLRAMAEKVDPDSRRELLKIAKTAMTTKLVSEDAPFLARLVVDAVRQIAEKTDQGYRLDLDNIKIEKKPGASVTDSKLIQGVVLDKKVTHPTMSKLIEDAELALIDCPLEVERTEFAAEIKISDPDEIRRFLEEENTILKQKVHKIKQVGASVVFCQKGIDDVAEHYLAREGLTAFRRVKESDMTRLCKATGGRVVTDLNNFEPEDLGTARRVEEKGLEEQKWVFVEGCKNPRAVTLLIRGGSMRIVEETERALHDGLMVTKDVVEHPLVLAGGGAPEAEVAYRIRKWAHGLDDRRQLAAIKFADSVESLALILADNAGADPIDTGVELVARHGRGEKWAGVDATTGRVADMWKRSVIEPLVVKAQVLNSATEAACMILRIDHIIPQRATQAGWEQLTGTN